MYNGDFNNLLKIIKDLVINKILKTLFCESCTFEKQHKVYNKELLNYKIINSDKR